MNTTLQKSCGLSQFLRVFCLSWVMAGILSVSTQAQESPVTQGNKGPTEIPVESGAVYVGGLLGLGYLNQDINLKIPIGVFAGYKVRDSASSFGLFYYYLGLGSDEIQATPGGPRTQIDRGSLTWLGGEYQYTWEETFPGWHAGVRVGVSRHLRNDQETQSDFLFGPSIGMDKLMTQRLSLGGEAQFFWVTQSPALTSLQLALLLKLWL